MSELNDRLKEFYTQRNLSARAFERKCGLTQGVIGRCQEGLHTGNLVKILTTFPEIDVYWLLGVPKPDGVISYTSEERKPVESPKNGQETEMVEFLKEQVARKDEQIRVLMDLLQKGASVSQSINM